MTETCCSRWLNDARDAYSTGSAAVRRGAAYVLALAAWQRDDVHDAMRWLGRHHPTGDTTFPPDVLVLADPGRAGCLGRR